MVQLSEVLGSAVIIFIIIIGVKYITQWIVKQQVKNELCNGTDARDPTTSPTEDSHRN
jgi:hypothetical protein